MSCFLPPIRAFPFYANWVHCAVPRLVYWLYLVHALARRPSRIQGRNTEKCQTENIENKMRNDEEKEKTKHDNNRTSY